MENSKKRPSFFWLISEPGRALTELAISQSYQSLFKNQTQGDGHPVMILPGFMSTKKSTGVLRNYISNLGYDVYDWGLGRNLGKVEYMALLLEQLDEIYKKKGQQISLIGWSLGGVFARQLAKERPDLIRQVITLGSPFSGITDPNNVQWVYEIISGGKKVQQTNPELVANMPIPAPVPTTAIYSKEDGIVPWEACMEREEDDFHQNVQVRGSHIGLGVNVSVLSIIAKQLPYNKSNWRYFQPKGYINHLIYPSL
jgi:hypothetical protein